MSYELQADEEYFINTYSYDDIFTSYKLSIDFNGGIDSADSPNAPAPVIPPPDTPNTPSGYAGINIANTVNYFQEHITDYAVI